MPLSFTVVIFADQCWQFHPAASSRSHATLKFGPLRRMLWFRLARQWTRSDASTMHFAMYSTTAYRRRHAKSCPRTFSSPSFFLRREFPLPKGLVCFGISASPSPTQLQYNTPPSWACRLFFKLYSLITPIEGNQTGIHIASDIGRYSSAGRPNPRLLSSSVPSVLCIDWIREIV